MIVERVRRLWTERLTLRRPHEDDLVSIFNIMSNAEAMKFWSCEPHKTLAETNAWFAATLRADRDHLSDEFIIEQDGCVIGKLGIWRGEEIGLFLHPSWWGRGLASEALERFIQHALSEGYSRLRADVDPRNAACLRLLEKCGFRVIGASRGTYVIAGKRQDSVFLELPLARAAFSKIERNGT